MSTSRPNFEKKELAISSTPYIYLPVDINLYTVEVSHREAIDGELLQQALDKAIERMPYLADTFAVENGAVYYAKNPLPMVAAHTQALRRVGGSETNYHMLDLTWDGNKTWFSMFHGFCDGQGINAFIETTLYYYYCLKDGVKYEPNGIRTDSSPMTPAETFDPLEKTYELDPDFAMPERKEQPRGYHLPEVYPDSTGQVREYGFRLPSEPFMAYVKANKASPAVMMSMLVGEAIQRLHPDADAPVLGNIPISVRRMLGCEETFKNCSSRAVLPISGTPLDALPFEQRAVQLRGILKQQMNPNVFRAIYNMIGPMYLKRMEEATDYREECKKPSGFISASHDTFYVDYIGSMHKTAYSEQITDVRFLCKPAGGNTLHMNVIEHNGQFRIACLACSDVSALCDALEQVIRAHGLPVERTPEQRFALPLENWREGIL